MLLKYFYDQKLAHASYLVGCQKTKEAVIVDPGRDIEQYIEMADREGVEIMAVAGTHIHADHVSGARELADRVGATLYVSDEGPTEWKYLFLDGYQHQLVHDGDHFMIGNIKFDVLHTPGHTPESISFVLTDQGGGANQPMGIFTGDIVLVGSIGRPDLLEEAAGLMGTAEPRARDLFKSAERFKSMPDYLQVWPAHGAGSACGKGLGAIPSSTVGDEKLFNPSLQFNDEEQFVKYILADQPEAPEYFAVMKRVNKEGPRVLGKGHHHSMLDVAKLPAAVESGNVVDLTPSPEFAVGHVAGSINIPVGMLAAWAGWLVDYDRPTYLICKPQQLEAAARILHKIGVEQIAGGFNVDEVRESGLATEVYATGTPADVSHAIATEEVQLIDVRPNSVETLTQSDVPEIADRIKEHVEWMEYRIENTNPIRMRDPLFAELFKHTDKIKMVHEDTEKGVKVTETSDDPCVAKLIQTHAIVVSGFVECGFAEAMKNHPVHSGIPARKTEPSHPIISGHGGVMQLPDAAMQPRSGTKLLVDVTRGGDPAELNGALEKVAKYLNIHAGGGAEPADAHIAVVFHGDATLIVLNPDAYTNEFGTKGNPNLKLLQQLHEADVEMYVCGQSLISKGSSPDEVAVFIETAVSALTAVVNLQSDGYAYLPLRK